MKIESWMASVSKPRLFCTTAVGLGKEARRRTCECVRWRLMETVSMPLETSPPASFADTFVRKFINDSRPDLWDDILKKMRYAPSGRMVGSG